MSRKFRKIRKELEDQTDLENLLGGIQDGSILKEKKRQSEIDNKSQKFKESESLNKLRPQLSQEVQKKSDLKRKQPSNGLRSSDINRIKEFMLNYTSGEDTNGKMYIDNANDVSNKFDEIPVKETITIDKNEKDLIIEELKDDVEFIEKLRKSSIPKTMGSGLGHKEVVNLIQSVITTSGGVDATSVEFDNTNTVIISGGNVQEAIEQIDSDISDLNNSLTTPDTSLIYVSTSGDDVSNDGSYNKPFKSIGHAMGTINDSSPSKKYTIYLYPGVYEEGTIVFEPYTTINGFGDEESTEIRSVSAGAPLLSAFGESSVRRCRLSNTLSAFAVEHHNTGTFILEDIIFDNCANGVNVNNPNARLEMTHTEITNNTTTMDYFFKGESGIGVIRATDVVTVSSPINTLFSIENFASLFTVKDVTSFTPQVGTLYDISTSARGVMQSVNAVAMGTGFKVNDGANARFNDVSVFNAQGYTLESTSGAPVTIALNAATLQDGTSGDINMIIPDSTLFGHGNINSTQGIVVPEVNVYGSFVNLVGGDEGVHILGELHVGSPTRPVESSFGEGDSYTSKMLVYTYNASTSAFEDVTVSAASNINSSFSFPGTAVDNSVYVASTVDTDSGKANHYGIKIDVLNAHDGTGKIITEYWNGSAWVEVVIMVTDGTSPFLPEATSEFEASGSHQIRYDNRLVVDGWTLSDPVGYGTDLYWVRYRVVSATNVAPEIEQIKLHSSRFEINGDGWIEYFGKARPIGKLPWNSNQFQPASTNPANGDVFYSANLDIGLVENSLSNGNRIGFQSTVPLDCDTSTPIDLNIALRPDSTGVWEYTVRWAHITPGSSAYPTSVAAPVTHPNEQSVTTSASVTTNTVEWVHLDIDVSESISRRANGFADIVALTIESVSGPTVDIIDIDGNYTKWCEGGHIG
jgi:hypothetical protein